METTNVKPGEEMKNCANNGEDKLDISRLENEVRRLGDCLEESTEKDKIISSLNSQLAQAQEKVLRKVFLSPMLDNLILLHDSIAEKTTIFGDLVKNQHKYNLSDDTRKLLVWFYERFLAVKKELLETLARESIRISADQGIKFNPKVHIVRETIPTNIKEEHHLISEVSRQGFVGEAEWVIRKADVVVKVFSNSI